MTRRGILLTAALVLALWTSAERAQSYVLLGSKWPDGNVTMELQLGTTSQALGDGMASWNASAEDALATWNANLGRLKFLVVRNSTAAEADGNRLNNVFFSNTVYGSAFDSTTLAITTEWSAGTRKTEADVIFNSKLSWDSYRGNLKNRIYDFHRVALHEFGHVVGLDHPDEYGQRVTAQMNSTISNLDSLAADDIAGGQALYGATGTTSTGTTTGGTTAVVVSFPPRNESLDFRSQLESKYRTDLKRAATVATYVDNEGDVVWTSEYFRYRVFLCTHADATSKVMTEIGGGAQPATCGSPTSAAISFPARTDALDFRTQLEARYRDVLKRSTNATAVDNEGDVVWTQEYLRYRVNGCTHADAVSRVFLQIDGKGVQPVCR